MKLDAAFSYTVALNKSVIEKNEIFVKNILFNRKNDVNNTFNFLCFQKEKNFLS